MDFLRDTEKHYSRFWICCSIRFSALPDHIILGGDVGAHAHLAPGVKALKMTFLPVLGVKNSENQKIFFLQISIFLGPIDGINDIF